MAPFLFLKITFDFYLILLYNATTMLKIRMQRGGRTKVPTYRIVVAEHTSSPKAGTNVEQVGTYDPKIKKPILNAERIKYWISVGAKPSDTMHNMLVREGVIKGDKINVLPKMKNRKVAEVPVVEAPIVEATPVEAPVAESAPEAAAEQVASSDSEQVAA